MPDIQSELPDEQPYLLLPPERYKHVLALSKAGQLDDRVAKCPDQNFYRNWKVICGKAGVDDACFQDVRATCITEWFEQGIMPHEVQRLAGHSSIDTTMKYYVGIRETMLARARQASSDALGEDFGTHLARTPNFEHFERSDVTVEKTQLVDNKKLMEIGVTGLEPATS